MKTQVLSAQMWDLRYSGWVGASCCDTWRSDCESSSCVGTTDVWELEK